MRRLICWFMRQKQLLTGTVMMLSVTACGPFNFVQMDGVEVPTKITDFRFVGVVDQCALEVQSAESYRLLVDCWAVGKQLFVGCRDCEFSSWGAALRRDGTARIQIHDKIYPVRAALVQDPIAIQRAWQRRVERADSSLADQPLPAAFWLFHLASRGRNPGTDG
jgi:hypothetical protein